MSHTYYTELWLVARRDLAKLLEFEQKLEEGAGLKKREILDTALSMYVRYVIEPIQFITRTLDQNSNIKKEVRHQTLRE